MRHFTLKVLGTSLLATGLLMPPFLHAQTGQGAKPGGSATGAEASPLMRRNQQMGTIMKDMAREMGKMQEQTGKEDIAPEMRKKMSQDMKRMSDMMRRMSGLIDRPAMKDAEANRQVEQMRKQMDGMSKDPSMKGPGK